MIPLEITAYRLAKETFLPPTRISEIIKENRRITACSRQMKVYHQSATHNGFRVIISLLIAPDFTQDFIDECEMEIDLNLSLITSEVLYNIWKGFKLAKHTVFPVNLLMRDALISDEKILKALKVK